MYGLQRFKQEFSDKDKKTQKTKDGKNNVYGTIFSTKTHSINIDIFKALDELGYIQIESLKDKNESYLILEKLGFRQIKEAKKAIKAKIFRKKTKEYPKQMQEIKFKITDKPIDLNEIYIRYKEDKKNEALRKLYTIIWALRNNAVDIKTDKLGIPIIDYEAEKSIQRRIESETEMKGEDKFKLQYHVDATEKNSKDELIGIDASRDETKILGDEEKE